MKSGLLLTLFLYLIINANAQNSIFQKDSINIQNLILKKKQYHQMTNGNYDGYRIKIFSDIDRNKMERVKSDFQTKYPDIPIYDDYIQPNFILIIGNFKTKLEAHETLKKIQADYPNAFIIKTKILPNL
ncbi:MAG: hypothetical protein N3F62_00995 [Bacteroidia bacterium]|jgi:hypothetical protein|nr:hypothetical protein [Bacteroidia bacterium]